MIRNRQMLNIYMGNKRCKCKVYSVIREYNYNGILNGNWSVRTFTTSYFYNFVHFGQFILFILVSSSFLQKSLCTFFRIKFWIELYLFKPLAKVSGHFGPFPFQPTFRTFRPKTFRRRTFRLIYVCLTLNIFEYYNL